MKKQWSSRQAYILYKSIMEMCSQVPFLCLWYEGKMCVHTSRYLLRPNYEDSCGLHPLGNARHSIEIWGDKQLVTLLVPSGIPLFYSGKMLVHCIYTFMWMHICTVCNTHLHTHTHSHTHIMQTCTNTCTHTHTHKQTYPYTHTHMHIHSCCT